jgi:hypothetical protein
MMSLAGTRTGGRQSLDLTGAVTGTAGLAALIYGVMQSAGHGWASAQVLGPAGAGLLLLAVFTVAEARFSTQPLLPLRLFRTRRVTAGNVMLLLFGAIAIAMWYFTSLFPQNVLGYSALRVFHPLTTERRLFARALPGSWPRYVTFPIGELTPGSESRPRPANVGHDNCGRRGGQRDRLPGCDLERFGMCPAVMPGQDLSEVAGPVGDGAAADLAAGDRQLRNGHGEAAGR